MKYNTNFNLEVSILYNLKVLIANMIIKLNLFENFRVTVIPVTALKSILAWSIVGKYRVKIRTSLR